MRRSKHLTVHQLDGQKLQKHIHPKFSLCCNCTLPHLPDVPSKLFIPPFSLHRNCRLCPFPPNPLTHSPSPLPPPPSPPIFRLSRHQTKISAMKTSAGQLVREAGNGNRETEGIWMIRLCQNYSPLHYREEWIDMAYDKVKKKKKKVNTVHYLPCIFGFSSRATQEFRAVLWTKTSWKAY